MALDSHLEHARDTLPPACAHALPDIYASQSAKLREEFEATGDGRAVTLERTALVDSLVAQLYRDLLSPERSGPQNFCLVALGGYGRRELFPYSDIDLLFLFANHRIEATYKEATAALSRGLWDLRLRVGHQARRLAECAELDRGNLAFHVALLDCRYLAGDTPLFAHLRNEVIPHVVARDARDLVSDLVELSRQRHQKYGNTIFHLEPNVKEAPGGLRDYHVARWLTLIGELEKYGRWTIPEKLWPAALHAESRRALEALSAVRCFLHYCRGRDDNQLAYELQEQAAALVIGCSPGDKVSAAEWMRAYFRYARSIERLTTRVFDELAPARSSLYALFQDWKSRVSNADFAVVRGRIFLRQPAALWEDPSLLWRLFEFMARHGLKLSREAEHRVEETSARVASQVSSLPGLWRNFRQILVLPHAADALRALHCLGLLDAFFPEFRLIDALVVRDFYHRYTVDEHSFMAIQYLHELRSREASAGSSGAAEAAPDWEPKFSEITRELEQPELLFLALLFHDVGKGRPGKDHVEASLEAVEAVLARLRLPPEERETVRFLIANHLEMSRTLQRRDLFDPQTLQAFGGKVGTHERLKMLCLFSYADIKAVNPEALTPWKAEMLWQLYMATSNYLTRALDEERLHTAKAEMERVLPLSPPSAHAEALSAFLEGFPKRYLAAHSGAEIAAHFERARQLAANPVQLSLRSRNHGWELTVITSDRPFLFASITGTLAAWGMNIVKADAFSNRAGIVLDTFRFVDLFRTLDLNPSEVSRFKVDLTGVLSGKLDLQRLMKGRVIPKSLARPKIRIATRVSFDNACSSHSTLMELIAPDRPGLLYQVSSTLAELGCNIEVALIDTEGQKAIDAFYLTWQGVKLELVKQEEIRQALLHQLGSTPGS